MKATFPLPKSYTELRTLPIYRKGEWEGFEGYSLAALVWLGYVGPLAVALALAWWSSPWWLLLALLNLPTFVIARRFMIEYHTYWLGSIAASAETVDLIAKLEWIGPHESTHDWHARHVKLYRTKYIFPHPYWRRQSEGAAYGLDVALGHRSLDAAARSFCGWIYFQFLGRDAARDLISAYAERWLTEVDDLPIR